MHRYKGYCTSTLWRIPNLIRGLAGGKEGFQLPFALTVTQILFILVLFFVSLPLFIVAAPVIDNKVARFVVLNIILPSFFGYLIGGQTRENMNILRYYYIKRRTKQEPKEMIRFEEVEQTKMIYVKGKIRLQRSKM
ncbi:MULTISPECIES: PrgI family mobile element protein [Bacillus cereus group]|jgi:hypothetical protein|uniref:PrgI family protein n=1 Tax=Bacillus cereus TaxID=1396 RepID=A0A9X7QMS7_BACCE|nr:MULTISPECIES: PrgI family protein [Bacillus cereus group]MCQ6288114.1 PrgI family protein [Bacillus cereus]MCQ6316531.1 PrgI family protein [Bacillus cereus]MCQ6327670.1 PrgI family protein [Bacillus cereus]MCQ6385148.1 PrgI family protein [Bacillus cereus]MDF9626098.1 PrgI family protein [Bacillus cereus]